MILHNYSKVSNTIKILSEKVKLIVVTKNQDINKINFIISKEHEHFGENRVKEASIKWRNLISTNPKLKLHLIGKLQSNKVNDAFDLFKFIHTLDNEKLAKKFSELEKQSNKKIKYFIQVNIGNEQQKNGIAVNLLNDFVHLGICTYTIINPIG